MPLPPLRPDRPITEGERALNKRLILQIMRCEDEGAGPSRAPCNEIPLPSQRLAIGWVERDNEEDAAEVFLADADVGVHTQDGPPAHTNEEEMRDRNASSGGGCLSNR